MQDVEQDREKRARAAVQSIRRQLPKLFCREGNEEFHCAHMEAETYEVLARLALAGEKEALKILREQIRPLFEAQLYEGRITYFPETVHRLAFEVFLYGPPKTPPGAKGTRTSLRDMTIALMVKMVHQDFGFPLYVQPEHRGDKAAHMTAHRLIGEELGLDERTVEIIWRDRKDIVTRRR